MYGRGQARRARIEAGARPQGPHLSTSVWHRVIAPAIVVLLLQMAPMFICRTGASVLPGHNPLIHLEIISRVTIPACPGAGFAI